ncbi:MAG: DUF2586 domain-containing protein [Sphingobacteriaceae bacterium]|nr:DUF2586 domain-containing protein [Sphingobacteriaceae bacterium]
MLPGIKINLTNGALGGVSPSADGVMGLICSGVATIGINLSEPKVIFGMNDLKNIGITADNNVGAYRHVKEYYDTAGEGSELWLMLVASTLSMSDIVDNSQSYATVLLNAAQGRINVLGVTRTPSVAYSPIIQAGLDKDVYDTIPKAQVLALAYEAKFAPITVLVEGRSYTGNETEVTDLRTMSNNRVGVILASSMSDGSASVGLVLGRMAAIPVMRNIGRVKSGALPISTGYVGAKKVDTYTGLNLLHDKGYIVLRKFVGKEGYYFNDDPLATLISDDYNSITNRRVIDKTLRLVYKTYVEELLDEVPVDAKGNIIIPIASAWQSKIENVVNSSMLGELSAFEVFIATNQNVLSTGKITITIKVTPIGYAKTIVINLGFNNPSNK